MIAGLSVGDEVAGAHLTVRPGEIVGLTGLSRSGAHRLLEAVYGAARADAGTVTLDGADLTNRGIKAAIAAGIGLVPADRKQHGLLLHMSIAHNLAMAATSAKARWRRPDPGGERDLVGRARDAGWRR